MNNGIMHKKDQHSEFRVHTLGYIKFHTLLQDFIAYRPEHNPKNIDVIYNTHSMNAECKMPLWAVSHKQSK